jgi:predicted MFS family arabinose efflux permease
MPDNAVEGEARAADGISGGLTALLSGSCGLIVGSIYFAQPLIQLIGPDIGLAPWAAGLVVTVSQLGYCLGLMLLAPLSDLVENRALILATLAAAIAALAASAGAPTGAIFLLAAFGVGVTATAVQVMVPLAAHLSRPETRGRVVGNVTGGLLAGILLARPLSSLIADHFGWRAVFGGDAVVILVLALVLALALPRRRPRRAHSYGTLIASLWSLFRSFPELRRRAFGQAFLFGAFSLFWTSVPLELAARHGLSQSGIALFALAGAGGALAAPLAGRLADRGWARPASLLGIGAVGISYIGAGLYDRLWLLVLAAIILDAGVQTNHVIAQRAILALDHTAAGRLNSLYITIFFFGGAAGSAIAAPLFLIGWSAVAMAGAVFALGALAFWLTASRLLGSR